MFIGIALVVVIIVNLLLAILVLSRNVHSRVNRLYGLLSLMVIVWSVANFLSNENTTHGRLVFANRLALTAGLWLVAAVWIFVVHFPVKRRHRVQTVFAAIVLPIVSMLTLFTPYIVADVTFNATKQVGDILTGSLYTIYVALLVIFLILTFRNFYTAYRLKSDRLTRQQITSAAVGIILGFLWILITSAIIPALTGDWTVSKLGILGSLFMVGFIAYAIVRHRLFDIRLIVARSAAYTLSLISIGVLYAFVSFFIIGRLLFKDQNFAVSQQVTVTLLAVILVFTFQPVKRFFDRITNSIFYRDAYNSQLVLNELGGLFASEINIDKIAQRSLEILNGGLKLQYSRLVVVDEGKVYRIKDFGEVPRKSIDLKDLEKIKDRLLSVDEFGLAESTKEFLDKEGINCFIRLVTQDGIVGYLLLGPKQSGNIYNSQDIELLKIVGNELAVAVQNTLSYERISTFNITLQQKVTEATRELKKTNEKLKALDEAKDEFISMASHQLRTPLTSVKGYISMILDGDVGKVSEQQKQMLDQAFISSQRMVYLIADLLNVSRLRTGKFVIEAAPCYLPDVIEGEISQLYETAKAKDLTLTFDKPKSFPTMSLDETKIRQVIMNFTDNSVYYTQPGGHITVSLSATDQSITFSVVDDGIGVPKHEQHHLFTKFYRAGNARKARPDGTGLGLFMAKKVVVAQGGAIIFSSTEGKGSTFGFTFPRDKLEVK